MKIRVSITLSLFLFTLPFISKAQIWKYPPSPFLYSDEIDLNQNIHQKKGIHVMNVKVYQGNDTLIAYTKYDKKGRVIEYKSEFDSDTTFYSYKKKNYWSSVKIGTNGVKIKRQIKTKNDTISLIETFYSNRNSLSKFYYDSNRQIIKAIHNGIDIQCFTYSNKQLIGYVEKSNGILKDSMNFRYSGDTVYYSTYLISQNEISKYEEIYGVFQKSRLVQINTLENYVVENLKNQRFFFTYDEQGKIQETGIEYLVNSEYKRDYTEVFDYNEKGLLKSRILFFNNNTSKPLCEYYYEMY